MIDRSTSPSSLYFDIIALAREAGILAILPLAFYNFIMSNDLETIINGAPRDDGSLAVLCVADLSACFLGIEAVRLAQTEYTFSWLTDTTLPSERCDSREVCLLFKSSQIIRFWKPPPCLAAIASWNSLWKAGECTLCRNCLYSARLALEKDRRQVWNKLPTFFGLPEWQNLKQLV